MFEGTLEYDYDNFKNDIDFLKYKINYRKFYPDIIVGITRGGLVPAVYLSHAFNVKLIPVNWSYLDDDKQDKTAFSILTKMKTYNILIVDDICDSGRTISTLVNDLVATSNFRVKTATLWYNVDQPFVVDFYINTISRHSDKRFVIFPWEKHK
jgi:hypoxanthine phosphoribosyltransferase